MDYAIEARGLTKSFGKTRALDGVDLEVPEGRVLGVLGPNGAGKTTAVRILATLLRPDAGSARVSGYDVLGDPSAVRRVIGLTGQYASVDEDLTGVQNLVMIGRLLHLSPADAKRRAAELLEDFELTDAGRRPAKTYSGGMRRRLDLAASLVGRPSVVYLDEPTTGLDPAKRDDVWRMVRGLAQTGVTVLLTTQYLEEADALADDITVIDHGRVIAHDTPRGLKRLVGGQTLEVRPTRIEDVPEVARILAEVGGREPDRPAPDLVAVPVSDDGSLIEAVDRLARGGIPVTELALRLPSLDEVFATLTGRSDSASPDPSAASNPPVAPEGALR